MSIYYLDSSAWVKRYFNEPGSDRLDELFDGTGHIASTPLAHVEVTAAIARQGAARNLHTAFARVPTHSRLEQLHPVALECGVMARAATIAQHYKVRGADAVHLAAANRLKRALQGVDEPVVLITSDQEMLQAAARLSIGTEDPAADVRK